MFTVKKKGHWARGCPREKEEEPPFVTKPFHLFVAKSKGMEKRVLTQKLSPWKRPVAYLSKKAKKETVFYIPPPTSAKEVRKVPGHCGLLQIVDSRFC